MTENKNLLILVVIFALAAGTGIAFWKIDDLKEFRKESVSMPSANKDYNLTVVIKPYNYGAKRECKGVWREGITAMDAIKECDKAANLGLKLIHDAEIHKADLVDEMLGIKNGQDNRFWLYYVNNKFITNKVTPEPMPEKFVLKPNDRVEWRFEEWVTAAEAAAAAVKSN